MSAYGRAKDGFAVQKASIELVKVFEKSIEDNRTPDKGVYEKYKLTEDWIVDIHLSLWPMAHETAQRLIAIGGEYVEFIIPEGAGPGKSYDILLRVNPKENASK